ncbi:hypothetical protein E5285_13305 [Escherichia coli]|nr:hypothetical protein E5285_13305 [Escherichia coli]
MLMQSEHFRRYAFLLCPQYQVSRMESSRSPFLTPDIPPNLFCTAYIMWICPYISRHLLSLNPLQARCRRYSRGER